MRLLRRYKPFYKAGAMDFLAFRFTVFAWVLVTAFQVACSLFLWIAVYRNSADGLDSIINGFTFRQMMVYLVFNNIMTFVTFQGETQWTMDMDIQKGTIDLAFTKPISYRGRLMFQALGHFVMANLLIGWPMFAIAYTVFALLGYLTVSWMLIPSVLLFLLAQVFACLLTDTVSYLCGVLCFYTSSGWGIAQAKNVIVAALSGSIVPLSFIPGDAGKVLTYLPFAGMAYQPILILIGKSDLLMSIHTVGFSLTWLIALNLLAALVFNHASKKVTVHGG